jgi:hypothetical protein
MKAAKTEKLIENNNIRIALKHDKPNEMVAEEPPINNDAAHIRNDCSITEL